MNAIGSTDPRHAGASRPRVSVVTTFLNEECFLAAAVDSVLAQAFQDLELILVDDGSTDASTRIARDYAARYTPVIRYLEHQGHANRGMSASRNAGITAAIGELVAFLDADDVWEPMKLAEQVAIMDAHPEVGMVCGAARYWQSWSGGSDTIVQPGHRVNEVVSPPEATLAVYPLGKASSPCPSALLIRRDVLAGLGGFEEHFVGMLQLYEDQGLLAKLYLTAPVYFSDKVWINYRLHAASFVSRAKSEGSYDQVRCYFLNWLERYVASVPRSDRRVREAIQRNLWRFRHPILYRALQKSSAVLQRGRRAAARLTS
jgi:glycosyltransferase involved in cell wall biosynthesis